MNKRIVSFSIILIYIYGNTLFSQTQSLPGFFPMGKVIEQVNMESKILKIAVNYAVYLPPDYEKSSRSYPVVYLLHGFSDNETAWIQFGEVQQTLDRAIANRDIPPMIIVMPDGKVSWYINDYNGKNRYEDMIFEEFIPFIDKTYRTRATKEYRAVSGLSMGGYGSLIWSLHHPEMFSACAAFSAGIFTDEEIKTMPVERYNNFYSKLFGENKAENRITEHWKKNSVLELMNSLPKEQIEKVKYYIDCGDDDFLFQGNSNLHIIMRNRNISHEFRIRDGSHNWTYWRTNLPEGLMFIGKIFHR
jgi:enterochelin esterase-like enzyme